MSRSSYERALQRIWYAKPGALSHILLPLSWLYHGAVALRRFSYRHGLRRSGHVAAPVVIVGNLTAGGTGKTPIVEWIVAELAALGRRPGIVSRGYGRIGASVARVSPDSDYREVGDEALMLARRTAVPVVVGADRVAAARELLALGVDIIVSDDGLQHYRLQRDLEIVVVDGARGFGNFRLLPAGPLREPATRLNEADVVVVNGPGEKSGHRIDLVPADAISLRDGASRALSAFSGRKAWAVAGIGNPDRFLGVLREAGVKATAVQVADHGRTDLQALKARHDWPILMTEKDAVKYPDCKLAAWYVPVAVRMEESSRREIVAQLGALFAPAKVK